MTSLPIIVNLFGGPGIGKSRVALELTGRLKSQGFDAEYVDEWIKEAAWLGYHDLFNQPDVIAANQRRKLETVKQHCTIVVTDCPLILTVPYAKYNVKKWPHESFSAMVTTLFNQYNNYNVWLERNPTIFKQTGRRETLSDATKLDSLIKEFIDNNVKIDISCKNDSAVIETIENNLVKRMTQHLQGKHESNYN